MDEKQLVNSLNELAEKTTESVRPSLAEDIKQQIPQKLTPHKAGLGTISIIIDLRVGKLAAAAAIIITMVLLVSFLDRRDSTGSGIYKDSRLLMNFLLSGAGKIKAHGGLSQYEHLAYQNRDVVYYGDSSDTKDPNTVLIHWKMPDGNYRVIFADLHTEIVTGEKLIKLQADMLQKKAK